MSPIWTALPDLAAIEAGYRPANALHTARYALLYLDDSVT